MIDGIWGHKKGFHEIRLALVLNGGVSLAVWMGGVIHELDLIRRASRKDPSHFPEDEPIFSMWQEITNKAHAGVLIDIISGTSAGGLNGMLLASTIARGAPMSNLRQIWKTSADLQKLLSEHPSHSVLNGNFFEETIKKAIDDIPQVSAPDKAVTLFLTATALGGSARHFKDAFEGKFDVRDHRRLYKFEHDPSATKYKNVADVGWQIVPDPHDDLWTEEEKKVQALSQAARATASYPVAFPPVREEELIGNRIVPPPSLGHPSSCVIDGGVLNNAPFEPVLDAIAERRLEGPVRRVVVYIVPSAGPIQEGVAPSRCEETQWSSTVWSALNYPQEADIRSNIDILASRLRSSIRGTQEELFSQLAGHPRLFEFITVDGDGLEEIRTDAGVRNWLKQDVEMLDRIRRRDPEAWEYARRKEEPIDWIFENRPILFEWLKSDLQESAALLRTAIGLMPEYRRRRATSVIWDFHSIRSNNNSVTSLVTTPEIDAEAILRSNPPWAPMPSGSELYSPDLEEWRWGLITAERVLQMLRTHLHDLADLQQESDSKILMEAAAYISNNLRDALAITDAARAAVRGLGPHGVELSDETATSMLTDIFTKMGVTRKMAELVNSAANLYTTDINHVKREIAWRTPEHVVSACLAVEVLTEAFAPVPRIVERLSPRFEFLRLGPDAPSPLFHTDAFSRLGDRKLYGIRMRHFGAFFDSDWRESDFAWGRMDAAHHILRLLVPDSQERADYERDLHARILRAESQVNGKGGDGTEWMRRHLEELDRDDSDLVNDFLESDQGRKLLRRMVQSTVGMLNESYFNNRAIDVRWQWFKRVSRSMLVRNEANLRQCERTWKMQWLRRRTEGMRDTAWEEFANGDPLEVPQKVVEAAQRDAFKTTAHLFPAAAILSIRRRVLSSRLLRRS
ncbi:patatin-like protein [Streptomyces sp. TLI_185]|uniref:patatin-like protein n=1 Tax=Streptomyces sp. TLI_185 TaxID=2485151 RepID=UPI000F50856D|nr:patatin-like protein [Streptomyces sp. TLI_185]